jgi:uncharacterized cupredoxin-like copper-binding protein
MKKLLTLFALLLASFALVACGGGDSDTTSGQTGAATTEETTEAEGGNGEAATLDFAADPGGNLAYTEDSAESEAGKVAVTFTNPAPVPHDVRIEDSKGNDIGGTEVITESNESSEVNLKPGDYTFYCSVPGHRQAGMEGDLTVE